VSRPGNGQALPLPSQPAPTPSFRTEQADFFFPFHSRERVGLRREKSLFASLSPRRVTRKLRLASTPTPVGASRTVLRDPAASDFNLTFPGVRQSAGCPVLGFPEGGVFEFSSLFLLHPFYLKIFRFPARIPIP
jgi:hypothetical protein